MTQTMLAIVARKRGAAPGGTVAEVTEVTTFEDNNPIHLHAKFFSLYDAGGKVAIMMQENGNGAPSLPSGHYRMVLVVFEPDGDAGTPLESAINGDGAWTASSAGPVVTITDAALGERVDAADGADATGFTITVTTQGE